MVDDIDDTSAEKDRDRDNAAVLKALKTACTGLLFPSESDKPIKAFRWKRVGKGNSTATAVDEAAVDETVVEAAGKLPAGAKVTQVPLAAFFDPVVTEEDWWGDEEKATAKRFRSLIAVLEKHLTDVKVFRVEGSGENRRDTSDNSDNSDNSDSSDSSVVDAYVVGRTAAGDLAGVSTQLIET